MAGFIFCTAAPARAALNVVKLPHNPPRSLGPQRVTLVGASLMTPLSQFAPTIYSVTAVFLWGVADFAGGYGSRRGNAFVLTAFSHLCAFALMLAIAFAQHGAFPSVTSIVWALMAGAIGGFSLAIFYRALASGQMGLTAPIAALLGAAIPTMVDIALEGSPSRWTVGGFGLAILAIWLITRPEPSHEESHEGTSGKEATHEEPLNQDGSDQDGSNKANASSRPAGVAMAALAGVGFAGFYLCVHQASGSPAWIAAIARIGSLATTTIAVVATCAPLRLDRPRVALGMLAGFFDITASALFIFASQHGRLDQAVVITSLYPAVTVVLARLVLKEHFSLWKFVGLLAALAAVPMIAAG
jgi:drug/metabolite transporter (DMT)-like permease